MVIFSDSRDPIFNSRDPHRVLKHLQKNLFKPNFKVLLFFQCNFLFVSNSVILSAVTKPTICLYQLNCKTHPAPPKQNE